MSLVLPKGSLDLDRGVLTTSTAEIRLTPGETNLLRWWIARTDPAVSREAMHQEVWGYHPRVVSRAVDVAIARLRTKLERDPGAPEVLVTEVGGYRLCVDAATLDPVVQWRRAAPGPDEDRALEALRRHLPPADATDPVALAARADALAGTRAPAAVDEALGRLFSMPLSPELAVRARLIRGAHRLPGGDADLAEALALAERITDPVLRGRLAYAEAVSAARTDLDRARRALAEAQRWFAQAGRGAAAAALRTEVRSLAIRIDLGEASVHGLLAIAAGQAAVGDAVGEARTWIAGAIGASNTGEPAFMEAAAQRAFDLARTPRSQVNALGLRAWAHACAGDHDAALRGAAEAEEAAARLDAWSALGSTVMIPGMVALDRGADPLADRLLAEAADQADARGQPRLAATITGNRSWIDLRAGRPEEALIRLGRSAFDPLGRVAVQVDHLRGAAAAMLGRDAEAVRWLRSRPTPVDADVAGLLSLLIGSRDPAELRAALARPWRLGGSIDVRLAHRLVTVTRPTT
ncbi:MAG: helix-turn-helix domain-containing protein [Myxococcota bacterium]